MSDNERAIGNTFTTRKIVARRKIAIQAHQKL